MEDVPPSHIEPSDQKNDFDMRYFNDTAKKIEGFREAIRLSGKDYITVKGVKISEIEFIKVLRFEYYQYMLKHVTT